MKSTKGTTLTFESDFDFETANAQFNDDITKDAVGVFQGCCLLLSLNVYIREV